MRKLSFALLSAAALYLVAGNLLDSVIFPEEEPAASFYPPVGYQFGSKSEGFRQTILKIDNGLFWTKTELAPHAAGPEHVHTAFAERWAVSEGTLSLLVNGQKRIVRAGETLLVPPGTPRKPFNETSSLVVVRGPLVSENAMPTAFSVFLTQAYGFFDESPSNARPPKALLPLSRFSAKYDAWLAGVPIFVQRAMFFAIRPAARLFGYRTHYEKYRPGKSPAETAARREL